MKQDHKMLRIRQLDGKLSELRAIAGVARPAAGWVSTIRTALGMSLRQLGERLNISKNSVRKLEEREANDSITLKSLRQAADALDLKLVYALVPKDGSLEALIERRAREVALEIISRTSQSMMLEDQENRPERLKEAVTETADELKRTMPRYLWD